MPKKSARAKRIEECLRILAILGLPAGQQNERSALTLLALLNLTPNAPWSEASSPLLGVTPIMEYIRQHYAKDYAPNSRETIRRYTLHQFMQAGLVLLNPDDSERPTNSPLNVYQIAPETLALLRAFGSHAWEARLDTYQSAAPALADRYANERKMQRIPLLLDENQRIFLSPGGQNILIKQIVDEFCPRFTPRARLLYVGDTGAKFAYRDASRLERLGVDLEAHGKMPDILVYYETKEWLVLIEAVTSHGPISPKRKLELEQLFQTATAGLVFVTAFLDRRSLGKYLGEIAWETEVWTADAPSHMLHFNGERFLGPYL